MIRRILVAVNGVESSEKAVELAAELAKGLAAELIVLDVRQWLLGPRGPVDEGPEETSRLMAGVVRLLERQELKVRAEIRSGFFRSTARQVLDVAATGKADLVVLGPDGRSGLGGFLFGNITTGVLRRANVPVLVVA